MYYFGEKNAAGKNRVPDGDCNANISLYPERILKIYGIKK